MNYEDSQMVRKWLMTGPGNFSGSSPHTCLQAAWGASGLQLSLGDFIDHLHRENFRPDQRGGGGGGGKWLLVLPTAPNK